MTYKKDVLVVDLIGTLPIYTAYFSRALIFGDLKIDILSPYKADELNNFDELKKSYTSFFNHFYFRSPKLLKFISWFLNSLKLLLTAKNYKAIHFIWLPFITKNELDFSLLRILKRINKNIILTIHEPFEHDNYDENVRKRLIRISTLNPVLVVHAKDTKEDLLKDFPIDEKKIAVIPHGPLYYEFKEAPSIDSSNDIKIAMIGTIKPYKRIEDAIELVKILKEENIDVHLIVGGKGSEDYVNKLRNRVKKLDIEKNVKFINCFLSFKEVLDYNKSATCILAPYERISQSGAVISALSLGTPVVGYKIGGIPEVVSHKENGYLAEYKNIKDLKEGVKWVISTPFEKIDSSIEKYLGINSWNNAVSILQKIY